jgi:hypothetical protein
MDDLAKIEPRHFLNMAIPMQCYSSHLVARFSVSDCEPLGAENFVGNSLYVYAYEVWRWLRV